MTPQIQASLPVEFREQMLKGTRYARLGEPLDIASMVMSDEGAWIQGRSLGVMGGLRPQGTTISGVRSNRRARLANRRSSKLTN